MNAWKQELWEKCNVGVTHLDIEANDSVIFGYLVCWFITQVSIFITAGYISILFGILFIDTIVPIVGVEKHRITVKLNTIIDLFGITTQLYRFQLRTTVN